MSLNNPLNVPLRIDATYSDGTGSVVPPVTDFSLLQQSIPSFGKNMSNTHPWLGDTARSETAAPYTLAQGIHLHWTLPRALRHGVTVYQLNDAVYNELVQQGVPWSLVQALRKSAGARSEFTSQQLNTLLSGLVISPVCPGVPPLQNQYQEIYQVNSEDPEIYVMSFLPKISWDPILLEIYQPIIVRAAAQIKMMPVPNRWLVVRSDSQQNYVAWVLESDRLSFPQMPPAPPTCGGPYLNNPVVINSFSDSEVQTAQSSDSIYQYLGAAFPAGIWVEDPSANRLAPLTCVGNGAPEFASSYTSCYGVFGFWDSTVVDSSANYVYTVVGWYSDPANDPASASFSVTPWAVQSPTLAEILGKLKWSVPEADVSQIDGSIYTATINVTGSSCAINGQIPLLTATSVCIGNTAAEALSAGICQSSSNSVTQALGLDAETLLNAAQTGQAGNVLQPDGTALIESSLHQGGFMSGVYGWLWEIKPLPKDQQPKNPVALPAAAAADLSALNESQFQFDRAQAYLRSERQYLFADWCRAMHLETDESSFGSSGSPLPLTTAQNILEQSSLSIDAAGMGYCCDNSGSILPQYLLSYQALCSLYGVLQTVQTDLAGTAYFLKRVPAPRHWRSQDPHIMMSEPSAGTSALTASPADPLGYEQGALVCSMTPATPAPAIPSSAQDIFGSWTDTSLIDCVFNYILASPPIQSAAYSWRPLYLQWQASLYPCANGTGGLVSGNPPSFTDYSATFLTDNFQIDANGIDYVQLETTEFSEQACTYNGRVILTPNAIATMRSQILQLCGLPLDNPPDTLSPSDLPGLIGTNSDSATLITGAYSQNAYTLSQMLDGFSDRLLMLKKISQVSVFDPNGPFGLINNNNGTWDSSSQSNYVEIGIQRSHSPQQTDAYNPIRAGKCEVTSINLIDAFGQMTTWSLGTGNLFVSNTLQNMTSNVEDAAPAFLLAPRHAPHSRILLRWITAETDIETNNLPASSPVCGWVALNRADETLLVFHADGEIYGFIDTGTGAFTQINTARTPGVFLNQVVQQLSSASPAATFYNNVDNTLLTIEPFSHSSCTARSVLVSRPLALAQASIRMELLGAPSGHQGYEWLQTLSLSQDNCAPTDAISPVDQTTSPFISRETCGFTDVQVPLTLGNMSLANDGLLLFWIVTAGAIGSSYTLVSGQAGGNYPVVLTSDPASLPVRTLMLLDPRAPVHLTSAVLPTKAISIPPDFYSQALAAMEYLMSAGPVITAANSSNSIILPIPKEVKGSWVWKTTASAPTSQSLSQSDDRVHLQQAPPSIQTGILQFEQSPGGKP